MLRSHLARVTLCRRTPAASTSSIARSIVAPLVCILVGCGSGAASPGTGSGGGQHAGGLDPRSTVPNDASAGRGGGGTGIHGASGSPSAGGSQGTSSGISLEMDPIQIRATVLQEQPMPTQSLTGHLKGGSIMTLNGETVYVALDDPASLFGSAVPERISYGTLYLALIGKKLDKPGHYSGTLKISVSTDPAGANPHGNSPFEVPYDVEVVLGLLVDTAQLTVSAPFGDAPSRTVKAELSPDTTTWSVRWYDKSNGNLIHGGCLSDGSDDTGGGSIIQTIRCTSDGSVTATLLPEPPGTYSRTLLIQNTVLYLGKTYAFAREIPTTYTVEPNDAVEAVFSPPSIQVTRTAGDYTLRQSNYQLVLNTGVTPTRHPVEYLT